MITIKDITQLALQTLDTEAEAILNLKQFIGQDFSNAVTTILETNKRVVITGIGKSAIIAQKIVATFNSTGTPSIFLHAADAIHGDLGTLQKEDIVICISKSGDTPEIKVLVPLLKSGGNKLIAIVGNIQSYLANHSDFVINSFVEKEACPHNLAPTTSTTAQLAIGDALAICLLQARGFSEQDFAKYHPGGALGKRLFLKVIDISSINEQPQVKPHDSLQKVILEISSKRLGATAVIENDTLIGIITDGDLRRMLEKETNINNLTAKDIMNPSPKHIEADTLAIDAVQLLEQNNITQLAVTQNGKYAGFVHLHDLLKEGIV